LALYKLEQTDRDALLAILGLQLYESQAAKRTTLRKEDPGVIGDTSKAIAFMAGS
jgi:hypothetical protein|tara:strand:+ start:99 stop:263 length:165 start_codon:yes stop_codon:yes gene_type:complete